MALTSALCRRRRRRHQREVGLAEEATRDLQVLHHLGVSILELMTLGPFLRDIGTLLELRSFTVQSRALQQPSEEQRI